MISHISVIKGIQTETLVSHISKRSPHTGRLPIVELMYSCVSNLLQTSTLNEMYQATLKIQCMEE